MRCDQCNKFVSFDTDVDPEPTLDVSPEGVVSGSVRIVNQCAECGQELKEATFDVDIDLSDEVEEHKKEHKAKEHDLELAEDLSRTDRRQTTDRKGKPIKNPRYQKQYYGAEGTVTVSCSCGWSTTASWSDEVQGSGMEELI